MSRRSRFVAALVACGAFALGVFVLVRPGGDPPGTAARHEAAARPERETEREKEPRAVTTGPVDFAKLEAFNAWSRGYMASSAETRKASADEGLALAKARRPEFLKLIKSDPARALQEAVPMVVRQDLPAKVVAQLEERVRGVGALRTYANTSLPGGGIVPSAHYLELNDGVTYETYTSGREKGLMDYKPNRSVNGVAIRPEGGMAQLALDPSPIRPLEVGERPDPALQKVEICPVSGNSTALPADQANAAVKADEPVVEAQGQVFYLCNGSHTTVFENQLVAGEGAGGGGVGYDGPLPYVSTKALGVMKVLYIPVTFPDENVAPTTEANAYNTMKDIADYYNKSSFGKLTIATTVTPCVTMPHDGQWYQANDSANGGTVDCLGLTHTDARAAAKAIGFDPANYDCIVVLQSYAYGVSRGAGGWGTVGGNSVWIYSSTWREVVAHEMGHTFGLAHANFWDSDGVNGIGYGANQEYGDDFDIMGGGSITTGQYNIAAKEQIKWFTADNLTSVATSGTYRVAAHDSNILDPALSYGLKIVKDPLRTYYAEVRQLSDADTNQPWQANGLRLEWKYSSGGGGNDQLIDTTPGSINGKADGNIIVGRTFSDAVSGIHLTPVAVNKATATSPKTVDVVVNLGQFPGDQAPTLALGASATNVPVGAMVTFNATASDPDGDALSYYWTYGNGDKTALPNAASITRTFSSAGQYQVTCTVSDMKGKTAVKSLVINVGTNTTFSIGGRVTNGGQPLANIPVATTGKETVTDTDGYYTLVGLAAGTYTVVPRLDGYSFTGSQGSAITVGPNTDTANFDAAAGAVVNITASVPTCTEDLAGSTGKFTLTRTGPTTNALTVTLQTVAGTATNNTDYTLSPAISSNTLTIPAGAASLDVTVTPKTDTTAEGPETVRLLLAQSASYVIGGGAQEATVTILDNDTTAPKVSIVAAVPVTVEGSATPALLRVSRVGASTTAALTVNYAVSGTATAGGDYTTLPGSVTIPAGASSVDIPVTSVNDSASEVNETVTVTLSTNAAYIIEASPLNAATATIVDDDLQILTVTASDATATEGASPADNGTFLVTRTGDTSQDLTLYYSLAGSALQGVDFVTLPGSVTIPAGQTSAAVTIVPIDDGILEDDQTVTILLGSLGTNYKLGSNATSTLTIKSNPANKPFVSVAAAEDSFGESGTAGIFRFAVSGVVTSSFTVNYTVGGTAIPGSDYTALSGSVTIPAGSGNRTIDLTVTPINDAVAEDLENVTLTLTPSSSYVTWPSSDHATMWLYDDEQPTVFVDASNTSPTEAGTASRSTLIRTGATTSALVVNYTMSGTATNGSDYATLGGTATIPAGKSFVDVTVTPVNDTAGEGTETIIMTLAPGAYSRSPLPATLYLVDNDTAAVTVGFNSAASTTVEGVGTATIPVSLSAAATGQVTVDYVVGSGSTTSTNSNTTGLVAPYWVRMTRTGSTLAAYRSSDGTTWTQQGTTQTVGMGNTAFVGLCLGSNNSAASQVTATFDNVTVTPAGGTFTGTDVGYTPKPGSWTNASGTYTLKAQTNDIGSSADSFYFVSTPVAGDCTVTARVTAISGGVASTKAGVMIREGFADDARHGMCALTSSSGVTFVWRAGSVTNAAGSGVDFTLASGTLTFPAGTTTLNIPVQITDDQIVESTENLVVALVNPGGAGLGTITQHTLAISDNDIPPAQPTVGFAAAASSGPESNTAVYLPVALSFAPKSPVTVAYAVTGGTAVSGSDYTLANGTLTFNAGETVKLIPVTVVDDAVIEPDRTILVGLSSPTGADLAANSSHTYTIVNDDTPVVTITATDATATEGSSSTDTGTFTVSRTGPTTNALTVNFSVSGTATSGSDYTAIGTSVTIPAGASSAPVTITPVDNSTAETSETVIVTLAASAGVTRWALLPPPR
ncbi:MAG: Calx-beta domain-containing protein [Luteolibacter sp.]